MSKKDKLEYEYSYLKTLQDRYFTALLALLTGMAALVYAVISGEKPFVVLWLLLIGAIAIGGIGYKLKSLEREIKKIIQEMDGVL